MNQQLIEQIVKEVMLSMNQANTAQEEAAVAVAEPKLVVESVTKEDYPLATKRPELIQAPTGKTLDDLTLQGVLNGEVKPEDVRISADTLELQAQVAESIGRDPFARNLRRAAELIAVPDDRILDIYNALRPYRSTKEELLAIADELEQQYNATINAKLVREAADVYETRDRLKKD
ncbi:diol dehydratase small subunit [Bacillus thermotolerans]|uniref:diol dehydratase small subunit n=1 Tax=Bacillus thermotolerans TaxID=1221996 RepID=UPI0005891F05|nr:diol dehydratase small subunit [Bacillus thermotolerans]KKB41380.1 Propanediol dehydratase small subunit [Bacillus thermotolerans]